MHGWQVFFCFFAGKRNQEQGLKLRKLEKPHLMTEENRNPKQRHKTRRQGPEDKENKRHFHKDTQRLTAKATKNQLNTRRSRAVRGQNTN